MIYKISLQKGGYYGKYSTSEFQSRFCILQTKEILADKKITLSYGESIFSNL